MSAAGMAVPGVEAWLLIAYLAVFVGASAFALNNFALRHLTAGHVSLYVVLMAPMSVPISALVIGGGRYLDRHRCNRSGVGGRRFPGDYSCACDVATCGSSGRHGSPTHRLDHPPL